MNVSLASLSCASRIRSILAYLRTGTTSAAIVTIATVVIANGCADHATVSTNVPGIPVYPGAELRDQWLPQSGDGTPTAADPQTIEDMKGQERDPVDFYFVAGADQAAVLAWYREQMPAHGWRPVSDPDDEVVIYNDAQGCHAFVSVTKVDEGTPGVDLQLSRQNPSTRCEVIPTTDPGTE